MKLFRWIMGWFYGGNAKCVHVHTSPIRWIDLDNKIEYITFFFMEYPNGKWYIEIDQYGYCKIFNKSKEFKARAIKNFMKQKLIDEDIRLKNKKFK